MSVIINNYNYGRFVGDAIRSALDQTYLRTEVVVVDDGSTDDSREVITAFGSRIVPVFKPNGGQASALNAGITHSTGAIILFLDADDRLLPHVVGDVVRCFRDQPRLAKVQFRLATIDAEGRRLAAVKPPTGQPIPQGDLVEQVLRFNDDIPWLPTSGNAFPAWVIRRVSPVPEAAYRICADFYTSNVTALYGPVGALDDVGGLYRVHGENNYHSTAIDLAKIRQTILLTLTTHRQIRDAAYGLGYTRYPANPLHVRSVSFVANRMISRKMAKAEHPIKGERVVGLLLQGVLAALGRFDLPIARRIVYAGWFVTIAFAPRRVAHALAQIFMQPEARPALPPWLEAWFRFAGRARTKTELR